MAFAATLSFTWSIAVGDVIPFLGALFAVQFLLTDRSPMPFGKALGMVLIVSLAGLCLQMFLVVTSDHPPVILTFLGAIYFLCFLAQATGRAGALPFMILVVAVMLPLLTLLHYDLGSSILALLVGGIVEGIVWGWAAHAAFPHRGLTGSGQPPAIHHQRPIPRALASGAILLGAVAICLTNDRFATALVIPITVASMLMQLDVLAGARAAFGLILVNIFGGAAASVVFGFVTLRHSLFFMFLSILAVSLILAGRAVLPRPSAKVFAGALTIFLVVLGSGISPLPGTAAETFATRIGYIILATLYSLFMAALLWPAERRVAAALPKALQ